MDVAFISTLSLGLGTVVLVRSTFPDRINKIGEFQLSRIFDNIDLHLGEHLQKVFADFETMDAAVGYFNLRGWQFFAPIVEAKNSAQGPVARILIGMTAVDPDTEIHRHLQAVLENSSDEEVVDNSLARERKTHAILKFREQLMRGSLNNNDLESIRQLKKNLVENRVQIRLFTARPLHGKTYIAHRKDVTNPIAAFVGSSNLTMSGLRHNYELNVDVLDWDGTHALANWFKDRWEDRFTIDITEDLLEIIEESWAGETQPAPYDIFLKICWHLSRDVREGLAEYGVPAILKDELLEYQSSAVKTLARRIATRGGAMLGDVVGLGKSITATAVSSLLKEEYGWDTLVICPKNLEKMWQEEYIDAYELNARVIPFSMVSRLLPDLRRYRFVIVDESHTMRSDTRQDYIQLREYIQRNDSKVLLLTATPYNIRFTDVANQLGLFLEDDEDLGLQPLAAMAKDPDFSKKVDQKTKTLGAFRKSEEADDWKRLMSNHLIRRTRSFVKNNYALRDENDREYLIFSNGNRFYFPNRVAHPIEHEFTDNDPTKIMVSDLTLDAIMELNLPRYGLAKYLTSTEGLSDEESELISRWEKSSGHLSGFVRTGLFKRLSSCGISFLISLERHLARNDMWIYAIENELAIPVGSVLESMLEEKGNEVSTSEEDSDIEKAEFETNPGKPQLNYETLLGKAPKSMQWVRSRLFGEDLIRDLKSDSDTLRNLLSVFGKWELQNDSKLQALIQTIKVKYPNQKILVFTEYADTANYVAKGLTELGIKKTVSVTGNSGNPTELARRFSPKSNHKQKGNPITPEDEIQVLIATDVLSEGQNLQDAHIVVNYDLPWAIIRLIQRAGRVDRVGQESDTVEVLSFFHESVEEVLSLRERIRHRLSQNAKAFGSDEKFFGTKEETAIIEGLYNGDISDDGGESDNDASSIAYEIWTKAKEVNPARALRIEKMPDLVFATRPAREFESDSVGVYVKTDRGIDGFGFADNSELRLMTGHEALKYFECTPDTAGLSRSENHFDLVNDLIQGPLSQGNIIAGQLTGIRKKTYLRLKSIMNDLPVDAIEAFEAMFERPLTTEAEYRLSKALSARSDEDIATLITVLHADRRLVVADSPGSDLIRIVCSMGVTNAK